MEIKILDFKIIDDGILRGLCDIEVDGWIIKCLRITQHASRRPYVVMSKSSVLDVNTGRPHLEQTVYLPGPLWVEVEKVVLSKFEEMEKENGNSETNTNR
jgi:hypothetical protein